nr:iron transporter [Candidatus Eremiobacteraeota bacterium]
FLWHPGLYHYGKNLEVPGDGRYTLLVEIAAPSFPRHDKKNGRRYAEAVTVEFRDIPIKTGRE